MKSLPEQIVEIWGGMECTINRVGDEYFDQLEYAGHRERDNDIALFAGLGLKKMRYPVLWEHHQPDEFQPIHWDKTESKLQELRGHGIDVIAGLVHHGSGPAFVDIREESFVLGLAAYAAQVAERFPWIEYYTPINEPLTTARFCGLYGLWYPHEQTDAGFCRILVNECKATALAMSAVRVFNPNAKLLQTDDLAKVHSTAALSYQADFENERRWLSYDLLCGKVDAHHPLWAYLTGHGIRADELDHFVNHPCPPEILGINYYLTSERYLDEDIAGYPARTHGGNGRHRYADVEAVRVGRVCPDGLEKLLTAAWERYNIPIALTEVHLHCTREEQMRWLAHSWKAANRLLACGIPVLAITPWALLGSFGWDRLLTLPGGTYEPGVFDISSGGQPRPTMLACMIHAYSHHVTFDHPVLDAPGWWLRGGRAAYGQDNFYPPVMPCGKPLAIAGRHAAELAQICRERCLNYTLALDRSAWATIRWNDRLVFNRPGGDNLIITLNGSDLFQGLNAGLDLFLDGATGYWDISDGTAIVNHLPEPAPVIHFMAG